MDTKRLRQRVLDLAIHGKLVPQNPQDEPASELLKRIAAEKERLVKEGKIKKSKKKDNEDIDEVPFEVPQGWVWCRLGDIFHMQAGKAIKAEELNNESDEFHQYACFGGNGIRGYINKYSNEGTYCIIGRQGALCGNIKMAEGQFYATEHAVVVYQFGLTDSYWAYYFLTHCNLNQYATATAQPGLSVAVIQDTLIPLPPLAEQHRIVSEVEKYFSLIDILEESENDLQQSIQKAKSKILDLAIKGKLVEKKGEWEEKRIKEVCDYICDGDWIEKKDQSSSGIRLIQTGNIGNGTFKDKNDGYRFISENTFNMLNCTEIFSGDILISRLPEPLGRSCIIPELPFRMITAVDCTIVRTSNIILKEFFCYYTQSTPYRKQVTLYEAGTTRKRISRKNLEKIVIPLPPLAEQHRIVAKIEELFTQLDNIAEALK